MVRSRCPGQAMVLCNLAYTHWLWASASCASRSAVVAFLLAAVSCLSLSCRCGGKTFGADKTEVLLTAAALLPAAGGPWYISRGVSSGV